MEKILIIEDDENINNMIKKLLESNGYKTFQAFSGTEGLLLYNENIDLVLLDLMLPGKTGEEVIKELKEKSDVPIIIMSAIGDINKKLDLFKLNANDYLTKPFHNEELLARIKVHLKNNHKQTTNILKYKDIELNTNEFTVICNNKNIILTKHEFELLKALIKNPNQALTKSMLFDIVWGDESFADENTLNVHISKIRNKLKEANPDEDYIETIWGVGYRMKK